MYKRIKNYKQHNESITRLWDFSDFFYLKKIKDSKSGKASLWGFSIKNHEFTVWIPKKAIYSKWENDYDKLNKVYKKLKIGYYIYEDDRNTEFFEMYKKHMLPIIDKLDKEIQDKKNQEIIKEFEDTIKRMIPIEVLSYDFKKKLIKTSIGDFKIDGINPLRFNIGKLFIIKTQSDGYELRYGKLNMLLKGKNGIIGKILIKLNSGQKITSIERMSLQRIYTELLKNHDWYWHMIDIGAMKSFGYRNSIKIDVVGDILKDLGFESFVKDKYKEYSSNK